MQTQDLSKCVETNNGIKITNNMEFSCENLPNGLDIDKSTGIIRGKPVLPIVKNNLKIHVSCTINPSIKISGDSNEFTITILSTPTKLELDNY